MNDNPDKAYDALFQSYEESNMRIKELEVQCGHFRLTISKLESLLVQAGLNVAELQAEITRLREGGCAREQGATQYCGEAQRLADEVRRYAYEEAIRTGATPQGAEVYAHGRLQDIAMAAHSGEATKSCFRCGHCGEWYTTISDALECCEVKEGNNNEASISS